MNKLSRTLSLGMSGDDVKFIQNLLKDKGFYKGDINGVFSQNTKIAVYNYQQSIGIIKLDGIIDKLTFSNLNNKSKNVGSDSDKKDNIYYINSDIIIYNSDINVDYKKEHTNKNVIMLYNSNSSLDFKDLINISKNITNYYIDRDGSIYRMFDDKFYICHLGESKSMLNFNKRSISITICNSGILNVGRDGTIYSVDNHKFDDMDTVNITDNIYEVYKSEQLNSLRELIVYLVNKHNIMLDIGKCDINWFKYDTNSNRKHGLVTLGQVKKIIDISPQRNMIDMLNSLL